MTSTVLLLGASRYYSSSIQSVRDAGFRTIVADRNPDSPGFSFADRAYACDIVDIDGIEQVCRESAVDVVVPLSDIGVLTASRVSRRLGLPGLPESAALAATNKEKMRNIWSAAGLPCPRYEVHDNYSDLFGSVKRFGYTCIVKPAHGVGGASRGVSVIRNSEEAPQAIKMALEAYADSSVIVEEFLPGDTEHSCEILLQGGQTQVIAIGDKEKSALPYRVDKSVIYPTALPKDRITHVEKLAHMATTTLGIKDGTAHLEFSMTAHGPILFEIGARCGGGATPEPIVSYVTGIHMVVEYVNSMLGVTRLPLSVKRQRGCVYRFIFGKEGSVDRVQGWPPTVKTGELLDSEILVRKGDQMREVRNGTDRIGFLVVGGENRQVAMEAADFLEAQIDVEIC